MGLKNPNLSANNKFDFAELLLQWYQLHKRALPWRETKDPYIIWISEVILQQTRVKQGLPYFNRFVSAFPNLKSLAKADQTEVLKLWEGLGYYNRALHLHETAKWIWEHLRGIFPSSYNDLIQLKGIGDYTASAIASFAFDEEVAVLDGNVYRVLSRIFDLKEDISLGSSKKVFKHLAQKLLPKGQSNEYNQAMMEFGAIQCTPVKPNCMYCVFVDNCKSYQLGIQEQRPVKSKKLIKKNRYLQYLIFSDSNQLMLKKRTQKDIWKGLYDFFLCENNYPVESFEEMLVNSESELQLNNTSFKFKSEWLTHILTHQKLNVRFWHFESHNIEEFMESNPLLRNYIKVSWSESLNLPKPILIHNYLENNFKIEKFRDSNT